MSSWGRSQPYISVLLWFLSSQPLKRWTEYNWWSDACLTLQTGGNTHWRGVNCPIHQSPDSAAIESGIFHDATEFSSLAPEFAVLKLQLTAANSEPVDLSWYHYRIVFQVLCWRATFTVQTSVLTYTEIFNFHEECSLYLNWKKIMVLSQDPHKNQPPPSCNTKFPLPPHRQLPKCWKYDYACSTGLLKGVQIHKWLRLA